MNEQFYLQHVTKALQEPLKPCPFCGDEEPVIEENSFDDAGVTVVTVKCEICEAHMARGVAEETANEMKLPAVTIAKAAAISAWNTRA